MKKIIIESSRIILMATIFSIGLGVAFGWNGPVSAPPTSNIITPINVGSSAQVKQGNLWLSGLNASNTPYTNGLIIENGNVGIGVTNPAYKLDVSGTVKASSLLVSGNVGINKTNPTAKLEIGGTAGVDGIKFPDGTIQTSASGVAIEKFGGIYSLGGGACAYPNPITGSCSCPAGFNNNVVLSFATQASFSCGWYAGYTTTGPCGSYSYESHQCWKP